MSKILNKLSKRNINQVRRELARAHMIIALLSLAVITLLALGATQPVTFDSTLSAICVALLSVVTIISASMAITLYSKK